MEEWKQIQDYEYEVSTAGRVRNMKTGKIMKQRACRGYLRVGIRKNKKQKHFLVHRLVATAFIPNPNGYDTVDHIDHNRQNNSVSNLRWLPMKNNSIDGCARKVYCVELDQTFDSTMEAERKTGINQSNICQCCRGKRKIAGGYHWKYVVR